MITRKKGNSSQERFHFGNFETEKKKFGIKYLKMKFVY